ncbi:phytanoyl-CoA dioxygenase family protein [Polyangium aurulentum]|uniref:phytanoyl-CoA dioxygenase family protein n=1 Tax=Polyangium aurulentum TaxID=2567896 RepID=UPI00146D8CBE|nr:phytanoyl-CoA dioxygenase family protein [Polyangium aurulentum]UQA58610.1 phytanoyl-CoA dioxygenase family protein [Polyangium aurulentum]
MDTRRLVDERGFAILDGFLHREHLAALAEAFLQHERAAIPMSGEILYTHTTPPVAAPGMRRLMHQWFNPHRRSPPLTTRAVASALRPAVEAWLGEPAVLFQDVLMDKDASQQPFPWHQDFPFWPVDVPAGLVIWASLDPVDEAAGGLALAAGSHRGGIGPAVDLHTGAAQAGSEGVGVDVTQYEVARPNLAPGDAIVFHPLTWHASPPNRSGRRRRVWASTWLGASARWLHARAPRHPLCKIVADGAPVGSSEGETP